MIVGRKPTASSQRRQPPRIGAAITGMNSSILLDGQPADPNDLSAFSRNGARATIRCCRQQTHHVTRDSRLAHPGDAFGAAKAPSAAAAGHAYLHS
jgi:hypothetical protein